MLRVYEEVYLCERCINMDNSNPNCITDIEAAIASKRVRKSSTKQVTKRTVKYLSVCRDPQAFRAVIRAAPDSVIKTICNAALNIERGDIVLNSRQKACFRQFRKQIATLTSKRAALEVKRKLIQRQKGGLLGVVPALLDTEVSALGSALFKR